MESSEIFEKETIPTFDELLENLSDEEVREFSQHLETEEYVPGETIFYEGETGDKLYIIQSGEVEISKMTEKEGEEYIPLITLKKGNIFGEMSFIPETESFASAVAGSFCTLFTLSREEFDTITEEDPGLGCKLYHAICLVLIYRLRRADRKASHLDDLQDQMENSPE